MDYLQHMRRRLDGEEPSVPAWLGSKEEVRAFARYVGVKVPKNIYEGPLTHLPDPLPRRFVLKPRFASTSIGVLLLESIEGKSGYSNLVTGEFLTREAVVGSCANVAARYYSDDVVDDAVFIVEELLVGVDGSTPPPDVRCYTFQGEIGLILMEHHIAGPARAMYFDGNFHPFPDVEYRYGVAAGASELEHIEPAVAPSNASDILRVARRISHAVPSAFCRVDLYNTSSGIMLGELTFFPGTFYYKDRKIMHDIEARRLGRLWDAASERLSGSEI